MSHIYLGTKNKLKIIRGVINLKLENIESYKNNNENLHIEQEENSCFYVSNCP